MDKSGPIIVIEDDKDDQELFEQAFKAVENQNEVVFFTDGEEALQYLVKTKKQPFMILSDINLPRLDGFKLREKVHNNEQLKLKCIPYLFFTTATDRTSVIKAYSQSIQGFFTKPESFGELKRVLQNIIEYWKDCHAPSVAI